MKKFIINVLICTLNVFILAYIFKPHVTVESLWSAFCVAIVLAILDFFVTPILQLFALPLTFITLGLFYWVVNAFVLYIDDKFVNGFKIENFGYTIVFSLALGIFNSVVNKFVEKSIKN